MASQPIYRPDPWPQQPTPHVPIPQQGDPVPLGPTQLAVCARIILGWWEPPPPAPWQRLVTVPIPVQGDQPAPVQLPNAILAAWQPAWYTFQTAPPSAAWNVPPLIVAAVPYAALPTQVLTAWVAPWYPAQTAAPVAPLTLPYGQQPPSYSVAVLALVRQTWEPPPPAPWQLKQIQTVSVDAPPPYAPLQAQVLTAWQPPPPAPWQRLTTAPIPAQGQQPTPYAPLQAQVLTPWQPAWYPAQSAAPVAAWIGATVANNLAAGAGVFILTGRAAALVFSGAAPPPPPPLPSGGAVGNALMNRRWQPDSRPLPVAARLPAGPARYRVRTAGAELTLTRAPRSPARRPLKQPLRSRPAVAAAREAQPAPAWLAAADAGLLLHGVAGLVMAEELGRALVEEVRRVVAEEVARD